MTNDPFSGQTSQRILLIIGGIMFALIIFEAGVVVGSRHAQLEYFGPPGFPPFGMMPSGMVRVHIAGPGHGAVGTVSEVNLPVFMIKERDGESETISISSSTQIRQDNAGGDTSASPADIQTGELIVAIGWPNASGTMQAQLIRILPPPPSGGATH